MNPYLLVHDSAVFDGGIFHDSFKTDGERSFTMLLSTQKKSQE